MSVQDSIIAAYLITGLLIGGLILASWVRAVRVKRSLAAQGSSTHQ